jgi:hypothetical protein
VSASKECNLREHYETLRRDNCCVLDRTLREDKVKKLKCYFQRQQDLFSVATETNEAAV